MQVKSGLQCSDLIFRVYSLGRLARQRPAMNGLFPRESYSPNRRLSTNLLLVARGGTKGQLPHL